MYRMVTELYPTGCPGWSCSKPECSSTGFRDLPGAVAPRESCDGSEEGKKWVRVRVRWKGGRRGSGLESECDGREEGKKWVRVRE